MTKPSPEERAQGLVGLFLYERLLHASEAPELGDVVIEGIAAKIDAISKRFGQQLDHLRSPASRRIPDAYLADEEAVENELQTRATAALSDAVPDADLAPLVAPNAQWALRSEASRVPRPSTRADTVAWSLTPPSWLENSAEWPPADAVALTGKRELTGADAEPVLVTEEPYVEWVQLGMFESQRSLASRYPDAVPARHLLIASGLEVSDQPLPATSSPMSGAPPDAWSSIPDLVAHLDPTGARSTLQSDGGPLTALVNNDGDIDTARMNRGIGLPPFTVVPMLAVITLLGLRPEEPALRHVLVDDNGPALVGRQWSGFLIHDGDYSRLEPAIQGSDVILRPDLYEILADAIGSNRLRAGLIVSHYEQR